MSCGHAVEMVGVRFEAKGGRDYRWKKSDLEGS